MGGTSKRWMQSRRRVCHRNISTVRHDISSFPCPCFGNTCARRCWREEETTNRRNCIVYWRLVPDLPECCVPTHMISMWYKIVNTIVFLKLLFMIDSEICHLTECNFVVFLLSAFFVFQWPFVVFAEPLSWPEGDCSLCNCSGRTQTCVKSCNLTPKMCEEEGKVFIEGGEGMDLIMLFLSFRF